MGILGFLLLYKQIPLNNRKIPSVTSSFPELSRPLAPDTQKIQVWGLNTSTAEQLQQISGLGPVLSNRIVKYRSAIHGFQQIEELQNVYGISDELYTYIIPHLSIDSFPKRLSSPKKTSHKPKKKYEIIEINSATLQDFQQLPGIGTVLGNRIIKYREALGQFDSIEALEQVYNLPDSTFQRISPYLFLDSTLLKKGKIAKTFKKKEFPRNNEALTIDTSSLSPIFINQADSSHWVQVVGISPKLARRIVRYRDLIGFFSQANYLTQVYGFSPELFQVLKPYLRIGELDTFAKLDLNTTSPKTLQKYPFWLENEWEAFAEWKNKIRRIDDWQEVASSQIISPSTLTQLKSYFTL